MKFERGNYIIGGSEKEVTRKEGESKKEFLCRILDEGSQKAKILKCADRISNMISLGYVTDPKFIERYCDETEFFLLPMALTEWEKLLLRSERGSFRKLSAMSPL